MMPNVDIFQFTSQEDAFKYKERLNRNSAYNNDDIVVARDAKVSLFDLGSGDNPGAKKDVVDERRWIVVGVRS